jgi:hypothetical protein
MPLVTFWFRLAIFGQEAIGQRLAREEENTNDIPSPGAPRLVHLTGHLNQKTAAGDFDFLNAGLAVQASGVCLGRWSPGLCETPGWQRFILHGGRKDLAEPRCQGAKARPGQPTTLQRKSWA